MKDALGHTNRMVAYLLLSCACGCDFPGKPKPADRPVLPKDVVEFSALYRQNCAGCHGADGQFGGAPPLNDGLFRAIVPLAELERTIAKGRPGTPMPAFAIEHGGTLTSAQIQMLAYEIKGTRYRVKKGDPEKTEVTVAADPAGIEPIWRSPQQPPANAPSYLASEMEGKRATDSVEKTRRSTFATACAACHGELGEGTRAAGAINDAAFLGLASDQVLRRLIITGRPDLKMPDYAGSANRPKDFQPLSSRDISDLVALLRSWRQASTAPCDAAKSPEPTVGASHGSKTQANPDG